MILEVISVVSSDSQKHWDLIVHTNHNLLSCVGCKSTMILQVT